VPYVKQGAQDSDGSYADLTDRVIGCAVKVRKALGPGFLESAYENALAVELESQGIPFARQEEIKLTYAGQIVGVHRLDMLVDDKAATLSYLKATGTSIALILNFGRPNEERVIVCRGNPLLR